MTGKLLKAHRLTTRIIIFIYAFASLVGFVGFVASKSTSVTSPLGTVPEKELPKDINLAHFRNASWIEASSYAWLYIHHPLFVIDGITRPPSIKEQWVPDRRTDEKPFITINLGRKAAIREVVVYHDGRYSERFYTVSCLADGKPIKSLETIQTNETRVVFPLVCKDADAVRLDFYWDPYDPEGHIRIQEIEVWGR